MNFLGDVGEERSSCFVILTLFFSREIQFLKKGFVCDFCIIWFCGFEIDFSLLDREF